MADAGLDVNFKMLPAPPDGAEFQLVGFALLKPQPPGLRDRLAGAGASMGAQLNFM